MSQNPGTVRLFRLALAGSLLLAKPGMAQDLENQWNNYLSVEAQVAAASALEGGWIEQRERISAEVKRLQARQSWYNGWIIELRIARNSARHAALADSLWQLQARLVTLEANRNKAFESLRDHYQRLLLVADTSTSFTPSQKAWAISMGRHFLGRSPPVSELPDYSFILGRSFENQALKRVVFEDLQWVIRGKLALIDSLLAQKKTEAALVARLEEFQRDIAFQRRSDLDLSGDRSNETADGGIKAPVDATFGAKRDGLLGVADAQTDASDPRPISTDPLSMGATAGEINLYSLDQRRDELMEKRQQYQGYLQQIETELLHR